MFLKQQTALRNISVSPPICLVPSESSLRIRDFVNNIGKEGIVVQYFNCNYFHSCVQSISRGDGGQLK